MDVSTADENLMITKSKEQRRTAALAYWRYAQDHLRAARALCTKNELSPAEAQPLYHLAAQALEFALKAFLRARGVPPDATLDAYTCALDRALDDAIARGLPAPTPRLMAAARALAAHHRPEAFLRLDEDSAATTELACFFEMAHWTLDAIVPLVAEDYTTHYADVATPSKESFMLRLRAELSVEAA